MDEVRSLDDAWAEAAARLESMLDRFREQSLTDEWEARVGAPPVVAEVEPGRFAVAYEFIATSRLEPDLAQRLAGTYELGPNAEQWAGGPAEWLGAHALASLPVDRRSAFLRFLLAQPKRDGRQALLDLIQPLDVLLEDVPESSDEPGVQRLLDIGAQAGADPGDLVWVSLVPGGERLLHWDESRGEWAELEMSASD